MITVQLGFNERLKDKVDLQTVIDLDRIESDEFDSENFRAIFAMVRSEVEEESYEVYQTFDEWKEAVHPNERKEQ